MKRLLFILCLIFSSEIYAQHYTVEYWFDQNYGSHNTVYIDSSILQMQIDVAHLSSGMHMLYLHAHDTAGGYSNPRSFVFLNSINDDSVEYICWFDQNYDRKQMGNTSGGILLFDTDSLGGGLHMFNLQLESGNEAELHSYIFYKTSSPDSVIASMDYVCWFDQDYDDKQIGTLGDGNLMFDVDSLANGWHTFNLQFGEEMNAELHSYVFYKASDYDSIFRNTEYVRWFDQDYTNRVTGVVDSGNILIDISTLSRGPHYLNFQFGEEENAELHTFPFYKVETLYDTTYLDVCDWTLWYDSIYTISGEYGQMRDAILPNCYDTVATLYLNVRYSSVGDTMATVCDTFTWYGDAYTMSGLPIHHTTNSVGCDSTVTLNLTVLYSTLGDTTAIVCDSFMWYGNTYAVSDTPQYHTTNLAGCDSTVTLNLTINYSSLGDTMAFVCDSFIWHGVTYTTDTMPTYHTLNSMGCDSTVTLNLMVHYSTEGDTSAIACDFFEWNGVEYYASIDGETYTLTNAAGCDSIVTLHLTVNHSTIDTLVISTTENYEWQGNLYDTSGIYVDSLLTSEGCDSVLVLQLTILQEIREVGNNMIMVYPNPTNGKVQVDSDEVNRIDVYNVNGQLVKSVSKDALVDISSLPSGVYTLKVVMVRSTFVCRVIKQ